MNLIVLIETPLYKVTIYTPLGRNSKLNCFCKLFSTYNFSLYKDCPERLKIPR